MCAVNKIREEHLSLMKQEEHGSLISMDLKIPLTWEKSLYTCFKYLTYRHTIISL